MNYKRIKSLSKGILIIVIILLIITFVSGYFSERVKIYIQQKTQLEASNLISSTIKNEVLPYIDLENMVKIIEGENNKVESIFVNTYCVNEITSAVSEYLGNLVANLENTELNNLSLPLGIILSDTLFGNLGPLINIRIYPVGSITVDTVSTCEHYGINNSVLKIAVAVRVIFMTVIPLQKGEVEVTAEIPLIVQIIQGEVPRYYFSSKNSEYIPYPLIE